MELRRKALILAVLVCVLITNSVMAMSSPNYVLDWMVPLSGGGGHSSSSNYAIDLTIGQTVVGTSQSASFRAGWGFWAGFEALMKLFLPLIFKN